jgi:hypothetical protein
MHNCKEIQCTSPNHHQMPLTIRSEGQQQHCCMYHLLPPNLAHLDQDSHPCPNQAVKGNLSQALNHRRSQNRQQ